MTITALVTYRNMKNCFKFGIHQIVGIMDIKNQHKHQVNYTQLTNQYRQYYGS
jgi:hypothetical protein